MAERLEFKGDYMGFTYNDVHSSELGIVRVSDGSRFNENLLPTMQDKTVQVPGGDGTYYFGSYYTQRQFNVTFAFDNLTEQKVAELKRHFGDKGIHDLIFDETPYKVYSAKVTGTATIKYIPFDEGSTHRLYKGEGTIQFTCYYPFARCWSTIKDDYKNHRAYQHRNAENELETDSNWEKRVNEWWAAARIEPYKNFGDIPAPFSMNISDKGSLKLEGETVLSWNLPSGREAKLNTKIGIAKDIINDEILNEYVDGDLNTKIPVGATVPENIEFTCLYF